MVEGQLLATCRVIVGGFGVAVEEIVFVDEPDGVNVGTTPFPLLLGVADRLIGLEQALNKNANPHIMNITLTTLGRKNVCCNFRVCEVV